jgi:hypothetical protein
MDNVWREWRDVEGEVNTYMNSKLPAKLADKIEYPSEEFELRGLVSFYAKLLSYCAISALNGGIG